MEIKRLGIEHEYETLACRKEEMDPVSGKTATSRYAESNRGIDGYIDRWLDDPSKEHISVLGEFGTGKTWFCLHYAAGALARYREAKERGTQRPRLPLVIPLRDYAKAVSVESLLSEFFFRKFEIPLPGYSAFEALNRMGKLLLIFDGFDEMAARVDRQKMIDNFWELARVVVPGGKAVLTCRTEHFPEAMAGRELLGAELPGSTTNLVVEPPQFEVVELETFSDEQIRRVLRRRANEPTVNRIMSNPHLRDLARRPVMTSFVIDALPDVDAGKPIDLSRIYLYAVQRKMNRDIRAERTFTSLADKLYFLCEVSVEMLRTHAMALNYRSFPDRIRQLFGGAALEQKDLDHWHYDMMGQTMMIRNADGDYAPAHRSLVEFFASYQYAAELGGLADDFLELCRSQSNIDNRLAPRDYTWSKYFQRERDSAGRPVQIAPLRRFLPEPAEENAMSIGAAPIGSAMAELLENIVDRAALVDVIARTATIQVPLFLGGNAATVANRISRDWSGFTLLGGSLRGGNMDNANLCNAKLTGSDLRDCSIRAARLDGADLSGCDLRGAQLWHCSAEAASFHDCVVDSNRVLVFVGKRAELMVRGSTLLDAAFRLHTHVGYQCAGGTIDGVEAPLDQQLHHGCQVWIRKSAQGDVLDPAWMNFAVTTTARAGINRYFAHLDDRVERAMESMLSGMTLSARVREEIIQFGPLRAALKSRMFPNPRTEPGKAESLLASPAGLAAAERRGVALLDRFEALRLALVEAGVTTSPPRTSVRLANIFHYARFLSSTGYETGAATVDAVLDDTLSATAAAQGLLRCREEGGLAAWMSGRNES
ncbi:NACHT domain-containing protein [Povalibacter uvarum]|nr:pentapeptide repeat-containing protein [Povalibacter uvarum]